MKLLIHLIGIFCHQPRQLRYLTLLRLPGGVRTAIFRGTATVVPGHINPDTVGGICHDFRPGIGRGDTHMLIECAGKELLGLADIGYGNGLCKALNQRLAMLAMRKPRSSGVMNGA